MTASGIWLTMSLLLSKMSRDNECDVPQAVREIRRCRKEFLKQPVRTIYDHLNNSKTFKKKRNIIKRVSRVSFTGTPQLLVRLGISVDRGQKLDCIYKCGARSKFLYTFLLDSFNEKYF